MRSLGFLFVFFAGFLCVQTAHAQWLTSAMLNVGYGYLQEHQNEYKSTFSTPVFTFDIQTYPHEYIGGFARLTLFDPDVASITTESSNGKPLPDPWEHYTALNLDAGPIFRYLFSDRFSVYAGLGLACSLMHASGIYIMRRLLPDIRFDDAATRLGISLDTGLRLIALTFNDVAYITFSAGCSVSYYFLSHGRRYKSNLESQESGWDKNFFMFTIVPYIGIGSTIGVN